jgi:hypothetical protein
MRSSLEVFCDFLELINWTAIFSRNRPSGHFETVIDVVVDQDLLCGTNRALHCMQLLHYLETRAVVLKHIDHVSEMAIQSLQALNSLWVSSMNDPHSDPILWVGIEAHIPQPNLNRQSRDRCDRLRRPDGGYAP